ncbi:MAG TPA: PEP-CTERM sorting domain-containing protein [Vicinamibacterales bacterium]|nr:PEP-CTERM sorting domain-containing protein [Vicinamibacterales bacterium]
MPSIRRTVGIGILLIVSSVAAASADPILVTDGRFVAASAIVNAQPPTVVVNTPSAPFSPFTASASATATAAAFTAQTTSTQHSSLGSTLFSASGSIDSSADVSAPEGFAFANGSSTFEIEFDLSMPYSFALTGSIAVDDMELGGGFGEVEVSLGTEPVSGGIDVVAGDDIRFGSQLLDFTGVLPAGRHRLLVEASTESVASDGLAHHGSNFDVDFALTPTPEPPSIFLLGAGTVVLATKRRLARRGITYLTETRQASVR